MCSLGGGRGDGGLAGRGRRSRGGCRLRRRRLVVEDAGGSGGVVQRGRKVRRLQEVVLLAGGGKGLALLAGRLLPELGGRLGGGLGLGGRSGRGGRGLGGRRRRQVRRRRLVAIARRRLLDQEPALVGDGLKTEISRLTQGFRQK